MSLMKSGQRGHVMPGGDRPFSMLLTLFLPQNPAGSKAWPLANWCISYETQCKDRLGSRSGRIAHLTFIRIKNILNANPSIGNLPHGKLRYLYLV